MPTEDVANPLGGEPGDESLLADIEAAKAAAQGGGVPVVVDALTTSTEQTSAMPDGTMQFAVSSVPVRVQRDDGWVEIDTDLVSTGDWLEPVATASPVRFSVGGSAELSQIQTASGDWVTEIWPHGDLPVPTTDGPTATYAEVLPGVDLKVTATDLGMATVYVVKDKKAAMSAPLRDLHVDIEGAELAKTEEGTFTADVGDGNGDSGEETIVASSPLWWDSSNGGTFVKPGGDDPMMPVSHRLTDDSISMNVAATVASSDVTYPIFVDPDWSTSSPASWYTDAAFPNQSYLSAAQSDVLRVGASNNYQSNMFFHFPLDALDGKQVLSAQLATTQLQSLWCASSPIEVRVYGPQNPGFTWNQTTGGWGPTLESKSPGDCHSPAMAVGWNVTSGVQSKVGSPYIQFGFTYPSWSTTSRRHYSRAATLYVSYNSRPNTPTDLKFISPSRSCGTASNPAMISATEVVVGFNQTDPDAGNVDTNVYLSKMSDPENPVQHRSPGLGAQGAKSVTFDGLEDGTAYVWAARGSDHLADGASLSGKCFFTIDRTGPGIPTLTPPSGPLTVGKPASVSLATLPSDGVAFIAYTVLPTASSAGFVFDVFNARPSCNSTVGLVRVVCPNDAGVATAGFAPMDASSTLIALPFDVAGNPGVIPGTPAGQAGRVGATYALTAVNDPLVRLSAGHAWLTQAQPTPLGVSIPDSNATSPIPLTLGLDTMRTLTANPIAPSVPLNKAVLGFRDPATLTLGPGGSFGLSTVSTGTGSAELWTCNSGSNLVTGSAAICDQFAPSASKQRIGYTWTTPQGTGSTAAAPLWICDFTASGAAVVVKAVTNAQCTATGQPQPGVAIGQLGYVLGSTPTGAASTRTAQPAGSFVQSFTVGAWLKPGAGGSSSAISTSTNAAGVDLGATATNWRFCLRPSSTTTPVCSNAPRTPTADWTHVSGVWDATNRQLRLYVNAALAATVPFSWPSGTSSSPQTLHIGAAVSGDAVTGRWTGLIADPAIFGGVATASQLSLLRAGQDPING